MNTLIKILRTLYACSVWLYPREYRLEFGEEILQVFEASLWEAAAQGVWALSLCCLRELRDYPVNLLRTHLEKNRLSSFLRSEPVYFTLRGGFALVVLFVAYHVVSDLVLSQMQTMGMGFFSVYFNDLARPYYDALIALLAWLSAAAVSGTLFALFFGGRARLRWFVLLAGIATLPWWVSYALFWLVGGEQDIAVPYLGRLFPDASENMAWIGVVAVAIVTAGSLLFLLVVLLREQVRFRWLMLAGMAAWMPELMINESFALIQPESISEIQRLASNALLGAFLGGMLGLLLKERRKLLWLLVAGLLLYPAADYVFFHLIYAWLVAPLFPVEMSVEQFALQGSLSAAIQGVIFGLPIAIVFVWLARGHLPQLLGKEVKDPV